MAVLRMCAYVRVCIWEVEQRGVLRDSLHFQAISLLFLGGATSDKDKIHTKKKRKDPKNQRKVKKWVVEVCVCVCVA